MFFYAAIYVILVYFDIDLCFIVANVARYLVTVRLLTSIPWWCFLHFSLFVASVSYYFAYFFGRCTANKTLYKHHVHNTYMYCKLFWHSVLNNFLYKTIKHINIDHRTIQYSYLKDVSNIKILAQFYALLLFYTFSRTTVLV